MLVNTAISLLLMGPLRVGGLALSLSLSQVLNFVLLFLWLERKVGPLGKGQWVLPAAKSAAAAAIMGTVLRLLWPAAALERGAFIVRAGALAAAIITGFVIYVALLRVLSPADLKSVVGILKRATGKERS